MATTVEKEQKINRADALVHVPDDIVDDLVYALEAEDDKAIEEYFYGRTAEVAEYLNSMPLEGRVMASFDLMHHQINALSKVDADERKRAVTRLNADALLQTCLIPLPPYAPWQLIDLMGHATMRATDVASDILLPLLTQKIAELPLDVFDKSPSDAPLGVHLLRIRSLGMLSAFHANNREILQSTFARYKAMDIPLLAIVAGIEEANCTLDGELMENGGNPELLSKVSSDLLHRQAGYEKRYTQIDVPEGIDRSRQYVRIASDAVAGYALVNNVETFVHTTPSLPIDAKELKMEDVTSVTNAYLETNYPLLYDCHTLGAIGDRLGIDPLQLALAVQQRLFEFMVESDTQRFSRFESALEKVPDSRRINFAEAFLATEFGDDLGDIILHLAEKQPVKSTHVFEQLQDIRQGGERIAEHFGKEKGIDKAVAMAFIKRATELLALAEKEGVDVISEELAQLQDAVSQIADAVDYGEFGVEAIGKEADYGTLQAKNHKVTITARPSGRQARLGFTVRYPKGQRVNVRLDYDNGRISLDIAQTSQQANASAISRQIGEALARGELAISVRRAEQAIRDGISRQDITLHGNHVREAFEHMGDVMPEEFSGFVNTFLYSLKMGEDSTDLQTAAQMYLQ